MDLRPPPPTPPPPPPPTARSMVLDPGRDKFPKSPGWVVKSLVRGGDPVPLLKHQSNILVFVPRLIFSWHILLATVYKLLYPDSSVSVLLGWWLTRYGAFEKSNNERKNIYHKYDTVIWLTRANVDSDRIFTTMSVKCDIDVTVIMLAGFRSWK